MNITYIKQSSFHRKETPHSYQYFDGLWFRFVLHLDGLNVYSRL